MDYKEERYRALTSRRLMEMAHILRVVKMVFYACPSLRLLPWAGDLTKNLHLRSYYMNLNGIII